MLIDFQADIEVISRIVIAFLLGGLIGLERELHGISAGIRTYGAICLGACVFGIVSLSVRRVLPRKLSRVLVFSVVALSSVRKINTLVA
jgi:uncharacterized membrane protein YhiD involved in acid resistance